MFSHLHLLLTFFGVSFMLIRDASVCNFRLKSHFGILMPIYELMTEESICMD